MIRERVEAGAYIDTRHDQQLRQPLRKARQIGGGGEDVSASTERI